MSFIVYQVHGGDEQRAIEALSFTQAHIYLLYQRSGISLQIILGNDQEWSMVLQLAKTHQWTALKDFVSNKPLIKKLVWRILQFTSPRLYQQPFDHDHSTRLLSCV